MTKFTWNEYLMIRGALVDVMVGAERAVTSIETNPPGFEEECRRLKAYYGERKRLAEEAYRKLPFIAIDMNLHDEQLGERNEPVR